MLRKSRLRQKKGFSYKKRVHNERYSAKTGSTDTFLPTVLLGIFFTWFHLSCIFKEKHHIVGYVKKEPFQDIHFG